MKFIKTFRGRLLLILAILLVATLGVQFYLNLLTQRENNDLREAQAQALVAGITLGFKSMLLKGKRVGELIEEEDQPYFDPATKDRIKDIIIINSDWEVDDSLNAEYLPTTDDNDEVIYKKLSEISDLPPLMESSRLGSDIHFFPNAAVADKDRTDEAHAIPIETSMGRWYVLVLLKNDRAQAAWRAAQPLVFTLGLLTVSSFITLLLVWRFSRPVANLSAAASEVADGNLGVRVPDAARSDEMGELARNFNDMAAELEKKRELESQLRQAEKSAVVGRLGSAIAHEIRNPLNYINLTLDHLRAKYSPDEPDKRHTFEKLTSQLKAEVGRINQQISDFLNYSRPANAKLEPTSPRKVVEESLRIVEAQAAEHGITIGVVEHEDVPMILADPEFLRSVFNNLFINAVQAMESTGGHLKIKIAPDSLGRYVEFEIADTGPGIAAENLPSIFEPYFSTKETGTGLGLAIVKKIVDIHNAKIHVNSTVGDGTTFTISIPAVD